MLRTIRNNNFVMSTSNDPQCLLWCVGGFACGLEQLIQNTLHYLYHVLVEFALDKTSMCHLLECTLLVCIDYLLFLHFRLRCIFPFT